MFANAGFLLRTPQRVPPWRLPWGGLAITRLCGCQSISFSPAIGSPFSQLSHFTSSLRIPPELSLLLTCTDRINWHGCANYNANDLKDIIAAAKKQHCADSTAHDDGVLPQPTTTEDKLRGALSWKKRQRNANNAIKSKFSPPSSISRS